MDRTTESTCLVHIDHDCPDTSIRQATEYAAPGDLRANDSLDYLEVMYVKRRPIENLELSPCVDNGAIAQ